MAKITALPAAQPITGGEKMPIVQDGQTRNVGLFDLLGAAGAADAIKIGPKTLAEFFALTQQQIQALLVELATKAGIDSPHLVGTPTAPTADAGANSNQIATTAFVKAVVAALVNAAPAQLDTLNEFAAALGNDANFAATITAALAGKATTAQGAKADTALQPGAAVSQLAETADAKILTAAERTKLGNLQLGDIAGLRNALGSKASAQSMAFALARLGTDASGQTVTAYGDASLNAGSTGNGNTYGMALTTLAGVLTAASIALDAPGAGELHIAIPVNGVLTLVSVTSLALPAGPYTLVPGVDMPANVWLPVGSTLAYRRSTGGYLRTGAGVSYRFDGDTGTIGDVIALFGVQTAVALACVVLSDSKNVDGRFGTVEGRIAAVEVGVAAAANATPAAVLALGTDFTAQTSTTLGSTTPDAATAPSNLYASKATTAAIGVISAVRMRFAAAGTGQIVFVIPDGLGGLVAKGYNVTVSAGLNSFVAGTHFPCVLWPVGTMIAYHRITGGNFRQVSGTGMIGFLQYSGYAGVSGVALTNTSGSSTTDVAVAFDLLTTTATTVDKRFSNVEARVAVNENGLASIGNATPAAIAALGVDFSAQVTTTFGNTAADASNATAGNLYAPRAPTLASAVVTAVRLRFASAGTGQIVFIVPDGSGGYTTKAYPVTVAAGINTLNAGTHFPALIWPTGTYVGYYRLTGVNVRLVASTGTVGFRQWSGFTGASGAAVTNSASGTTTDVAIAFDTLAAPITMQAQLDALSSTVNANPYANVGFNAEINMVPQFGQSLSRGFTSGAIISYVAALGGYKFAGGVRADDGGTDPAVIYASLQPLVETANANAESETPCSGVVTGFGIFSQRYLGAAFHALGQSILVCSPGQGATAANSLFSGSLFARLKDNITYGKARADELGKSFGVPWMGWTHGEQDINAGTSAASYTATVTNGRIATEAHAKSVSGLNQSLPMIMSQVATHPFYAKPPTIALAQSAMCRADPMMIMTIPRYQLPYNNAQHLTATGYKTLGEYEAYAASELMLNKRKLQPVDVKKAWRQGNCIVVEFYTERGPLVFDTSFVSDPGNFGFSAVDSTDTALTIGTPTVFGGRFVRIPVTSRAPIAGDRIQYAVNGGANGGPITGPRGCLRDSAKLQDGTTLNYDLNDGNGARPMYFYALISNTVLN